MLTITQVSPDRLAIKSNYYYRDRIKKIPTAKWDNDTRQWSVDLSSLDFLELEFDGELVYKTPKWILHGEPMPDMSEMYAIQDKTIKTPNMKLQLFDYQDYGVRFMIDKILQHRWVINADDVGLGKCHGKGTKILMYDGSIKNVEDITVGEQLMGDDGTPRTVLSLARGKEQMYRVTLRNGDSFTCNESHILSLQVAKGNRYKKYRGGDIVNMSITDYLKLPEWAKKNVFKAYKRSVSSFNRNISTPIIEPYIYGAWLGDGNSNCIAFTINDNDDELRCEILRYASENNFDIRQCPGRGCTFYRLSKSSNNNKPYTELNMIRKSASNGKHMLEEYKYGSREIRLEVLAGLLDTDGYFIDNTYEIATKFEQLKEDILFIVRSLGLSITCIDKYVNNVKYYRMFISGDTNIIPTRLKRKTASARKQKKDPLVYMFNVEPIGIDDYYGFTIDGNHLYLLGDFTVTHNTVQAIAVLKWFYENQNISKMLIVCKKSVKKQWADEIKKFTDMDQYFWIDYTGETATERKKAYKQFKDAANGILITNHHTFLNDTQLIKDLHPEMMIVDEVHTVKTRGGKMHDHIMDVARLGMPIIFLTGTPIMSRPSDIYGIACIADNKYFGDWVTFAERYITYAANPFGRYAEPMIVGAKHLDELRQKTQDVVIRRTAYEVSIQLPSVNIVKRTVPMDATQKKLMDAIAAKQSEYAQSMEQASSMKVWDDASRDQKNARIAMVDALMKGLIASKQAVATDPRMFTMSTSKTIQKDFAPLVPTTYKMSFKTAAIIEIVEDILSADSKVIIFSKFRTSAMLIAEDIRKALKVDVLTYTGSEDQNTRDKYVDWFRNTDTYNILVGTEAMSDSLNLQVANYVINIDQPDTFATKTQRIGRARRAGSNFNTVTVYDMITEGSKDEERLENIRKNMDLTDALVSLDEAQRIALINAMKSE